MANKGYDAAEVQKREDDLDRWRFAAEIVEVVSATPSDWSARIGIFGKWGEGKTTVLRFAGHTPEAIAKESKTHRKHAQARAAWNPSTQPAWLTEQVFSEKLQPALAKASATEIANTIGVTRQYGASIRDGYRPHPRHWQALAQLVDVRT